MTGRTVISSKPIPISFLMFVFCNFVRNMLFFFMVCKGTKKSENHCRMDKKTMPRKHLFLFSQKIMTIRPTHYRIVLFNVIGLLFMYVLSIIFHKTASNPCRFSKRPPLWLEICGFLDVSVFCWLSVFYQIDHAESMDKCRILTLFGWHRCLWNAVISTDNCHSYRWRMPSKKC